MSEEQQDFFHPEDQSRADLTIDSRDNGKVATIIMAHANKMNAMGSRMMIDIQSIFKSLQNMEDLRVAIIKGDGPRAFIGGAFVPEMAALDVEESIAYITRLHETILHVRDCSVPVIAEVQGYCLGAGMELAAASDIRIASNTAIFGMPEVAVGMPSIIDAARLPQLIGWGKTREMLYTGGRYNAEEAMQMRLVERVAEPSQLEKVTEDIVSQIMSVGPLAVRAQKKILQEWEELSPDEAARSSIKYMGAAFENGEPQEMLARFLKH